jgi:hypothetical protein
LVLQFDPRWTNDSPISGVEIEDFAQAANRAEIEIAIGGLVCTRKPVQADR